MKKFSKMLCLLLCLALVAFGIAACKPAAEGEGEGEAPKENLFTDGAFFYSTPGIPSSTVFIAFKQDGTYYKDSFGTASIGNYTYAAATSKISIDGEEFTLDQKDYLVGNTTTANTNKYWVLHQYVYGAYIVDFVQDPKYIIDEQPVIVEQFWDITDTSANSKVVLKSDKSFIYMYINSAQADSDAEDYYIVAAGKWTKSANVYTLTAAVGGKIYTLTTGDTVTIKEGNNAEVTLSKYSPAKKELFTVSGAAEGANSWDTATIVMYDNFECLLTTSATLQSIKGTWVLGENSYSRIITWATNTVIAEKALTLTGVTNDDYSKIDYTEQLTINLGKPGIFVYELKGSFFTEAYVPNNVAVLTGDEKSDNQEGDWASATLTILDNFTCKLEQGVLQVNSVGEWSYSGENIIVVISEQTFTLTASGTGANKTFASEADCLTLDFGTSGTYKFTFASKA